MTGPSFIFAPNIQFRPYLSLYHSPDSLLGPAALRTERRPYLCDLLFDWESRKATCGPHRHVFLRLLHADGYHLLKAREDPGHAQDSRPDLDPATFESSRRYLDVSR